MHLTLGNSLEYYQMRTRYSRKPFIYGLHLRKYSSSSLHAYYDVDGTGDKDDRTCIIACFVYFGGNSISWRSRKQMLSLNYLHRLNIELILL